MNLDHLIDEFVRTINRLPREPGFAADIPPSVRDVPDDPDSAYASYDWRVRPWPDVDWIEPLEHRLGVTLPPSYRSLVTRYVFPAFEAGPLWVYANTPEGGFHEFRERAFSDPRFVEILLARGYVPFAQPESANYDPICFDTGRRDKTNECPLVRIEHESVLCDGVIGEKEELAPSFAAFVDAFVRCHGTPP